MENVYKTLTAEEARTLVELKDLGVNQQVVKTISEQIYNMARRGRTEANITDMPEGYIRYFENLGYMVTRLTNNLVQISWL